MPRRRGAVTSRRTAVEDGRSAQGTKKGSTTAASRSAKQIKELPCISNNSILPPVDMKSGDESVAQTKEVTAPVVSDLGYLHKKFKKVAATFSAVAVVEQSCDEATVPESSTPFAADDASKREGIDSNSSSSPASSSSKPTLKGGRYVCPYCQHACAKPSVLEKHIRAHTNERPYPCVPCGFAFKTKSNLYKHCKSRTHVLKLEESGGGSGTIDPAEIVSDDTSDDNAVLEDSDEGEPITSGFLQPDPAFVLDNSNNTADIVDANLIPTSAEKFKTPYKPKFHNLKTSDDVPDANSEGAAISMDVPARRNPSPGFLHERISQIISKNQAIVETLDPIWPRRYVRQSSRDKESNSTTKGTSISRNETSPGRKVPNRERSCSLSVISNNDPQSCDKPPPCTTKFVPSTELRVLQEAEENQRKRCYSEGPAMTESLLRHSVRNLLNHPPPAKLPRTDSSVINSQNPEGSIIKDILLKSRGLLPSDSLCAKEATDSNRNSSSSFSVSALLNHSSSRVKSNDLLPHTFSHSSTIGIASGLSIFPTDDTTGERPSKRPKISPSASESSSRDSDSSSRIAEPKSIQVSTIAYGCREEVLHRCHLKTSLPLFGGEVEIRDGQQRTVLRIDPVGYNNPVDAVTRKTDSYELSHTTTHFTQTSTTVTKTNLNSGGGIIQIQHQPVASTWTKNVSICSPSSVDNVSVSSSLPDPIKSVIIQPQRTSPSSVPLSTVPFVPGIPGPYSSSGWFPPASAFTMVRSTVTTTSCSMVNMAYCTASSTSGIPLITVNPPVDPSKPTQQVDEDNNFADCQQPSAADASSLAVKFLRPNSLSLQPGTFNFKKTNMAGFDPKSGLPNLLCVSGPGVTLISPETPRPRKLIRQLYLNGHAYTYLGLKCSTRVYFCCLSRAQPMYVLQQCYPKLSMYSQWKTREPAGLDASSPVQTMLLYDSRQRTTASTTAHSAENSRMILTHSSYWTNRDRPTSTHLKLECIKDREVTAQAPSDTFPAKSTASDSTTNSQSEDDAAGSDPSKSSSQQSLGVPTTTHQAPKRVRIFAGGFKSTEEYTYVRGRGRGRYVCEECGIRCKKPSMLKKHIRTHTDLRPYTCRQCSFSFKTKGNLTKHMKSKAHHKKCTELGIVPVPTTVDEANIDEDSLARQEKLKKMNLAGNEMGMGSGNEVDSEGGSDEDSEEDMDDDEEDEEPEGEEEEEEAEEDMPIVSAPSNNPVIPISVRSTSGQFEDASEERLVIRGEREEEVARSLLDLGVMAPAGSKPTTYPYASHSHNPELSKEEVISTNVTGQVLQNDAVLLKEEKQDSAYISATSSSVGLNDVLSSMQSTSSERKPRQPIDLSTLRSSPLPPVSSSSIVSVHSQNLMEETQKSVSHQGLPPNRELQGVQPTTSGMLQAYLTEKALKEGLIKRHQVRLIAPSNKNSVIFLPNSSHHGIREIQPSNSRAHLPPNPNDPNGPKIRPEFMVPGSHPSLSVTQTSSTLAVSSSSSSAPYKLTDDGKTACSICNKVFTKPSQLRLHINIHYFERPFRCDACAVSFRTKGHLQKHKRSVTHFNKVNMNLTFGTPSTENPRPFKCSDCMIAFRIHGHLAKHLRSKMHIMKLECLGKLPFGTYAEMERSGINLNEIDTTDCHNSLESLQLLAHRLYKQDPSKIQQWQQEAQSTAQGNVRERTISESSEEFSDIADDGDEIDEDGEDSDGLPDGVAVHTMQNEKKINHFPSQSPPAITETQLDSTPSEASVDCTRKVDQQPSYSSTSPLPVSQLDSRGTSRPLEPAMMCSDCGEPCATNEAFDIHILEKHSGPIPHVSSSKSFNQVSPPQPNDLLSKVKEIKRSDNISAEPELSSSSAIQLKSLVVNHHWNRGSDLQYSQQTEFLHSVTAPSSHFQMPSIWPSRPAFSDFTSLTTLPGMPPPWHQDQAAMAWIASRHMILPPNFAGQTLPHNYSMSHASQARDPNGDLQPRPYSPTSSSSSASVADATFPCEICGKTFVLKDTLRQHMLCHAQPRPFVCEFCDAGFTTQKHLESHLVLHKPRTS